jgi:heme-degrading monooxygenase HmoA
METVVVRINTKAGMEDKVEQFYLGQQAEYEAAEGFISRTILQARTGTMLESIMSRMTAEQIAKHPAPEPEGEQGTEFLLIERWESIDSRMTFTMSRSKERDKELFPYLLPQHASEYYDEITG